jgi:Cof subfamily protein (haloacid dehalogenase superfamily)
MKIKLIAFDLDGTTLSSDRTISPKNRMALKKARDAGICLVPCTGRSLNHLSDALVDLMNEMGFASFPYIITDNGAQAYSLPGRDLILTHTISLKTCLSIITESRTLSAITYASFGHEGATDNKGVVWDSGAGKLFLEQSREKWYLPLADLDAMLRWNGVAFKILINFLSKNDFYAYMKAHGDFSQWPEVNPITSAERSVEFINAGVSKGKTVSFVACHAGIPMEQVMAIGDEHNDIDMISTAGFGVAMGNAIPALKDIAAWVTGSNDEDGLARAIEKALS